MPRPGEWEHGEKIRLVEIDVQLAVDRRTRAVNVRDIKKLPVGSPGEAHTHGLAHQRTRTITAGDVACLANLVSGCWRAQVRGDSSTLVRVAGEFGPALH